MNILTSNLLPIAILCLCAFVFGIVQLVRGEKSSTAFLVALSFLLLLFIGGAIVAKSTPGGIDVVDEEEGDEDWRPPVVDDDKLASLRDRWDCEANPAWPVAGVLSELSDIAYLPFVNAEASFNQLGFDRVIPFNSATMFGYVVAGDDVAVVVFRGSESEFGDWWTNISRSPMPIDAGDVHSGFWTRYHDLKPQIVTALDRSDSQHIWISGHSLGGALALCCAYDFELVGRPFDGVITFGQPMIARQSLANDIDDRLYGRYARFVNRNDFVARIPPSYRPCGRLVWFTDEGLKRSPRKRVAFGSPGPDMESAREQSVDEIVPATEAEYQRWLAERSDPPMQRNADGEVMFQGNTPYFADHSITLYVEQVRELLGIK